MFILCTWLSTVLLTAHSKTGNIKCLYDFSSCNYSELSYLLGNLKKALSNWNFNNEVNFLVKELKMKDRLLSIGCVWDIGCHLLVDRASINPNLPCSGNFATKINFSRVIFRLTLL